MSKEDAFLAADFNWVRPLQSIWNDTSGHVEALHRSVVDSVLRDFKKLDDPHAQSAIGRVINGQAGSGKTHLLGTLRREVWKQNAWFVLIDIVGIKDFWRTTALGFIRSLRQPMPDGRSQYQAVFERALKLVPFEKWDSVRRSGGSLELNAIDKV